MANRYIVDVTSDTHKKAIELKLTYVEGVIYNAIAYLEERGMPLDVTDYSFLHMSSDDFNNGLYDLLRRRLIIQEGNYYYISNDRESLDELCDKDTEQGPLLAAMMSAFIKKTGIDVGFDPLENYKNEEG